MPTPLHPRIKRLIGREFNDSWQQWPHSDDAQPVSEKDALLSLLTIHELTTAPVERIGDAARWATHPCVASLKLLLEERLIQRLDAMIDDPTSPIPGRASLNAVAVIRSMAAKDRLPSVYRWVADKANLPELRGFLAIEGGPDGGFDDLVAQCQIGLSGAPKMELARNYWDEMGNGDPAAVHTDLHRQMADIVGVSELDPEELPVAALQRAALGGLLATNRWLQPEMVGALGLTELQAGPRCRLVLAGFRRLQIPLKGQRFYAVHAEVDPRHGKDWLDNAVAPLTSLSPDWNSRMIRGAAWRWHVNAALFDELGVVNADPNAAAA
jgi:Iron-containing redox enzyme